MKKASAIHLLMPDVSELKSKEKKRKVNWYTTRYRKEALKWGSTHEAEALRLFKEVTGWTVSDVGRTYTRKNLLFRPDGIITSKSEGKECRILLEIKCPYRLRKCHDLKNYFLQARSEIITYEFQLNLKNLQGLRWYHQIQASLKAGEMEEAVLVIWTPLDMMLIPISRDANWPSVSGVNLTQSSGILKE